MDVRGYVDENAAGFFDALRPWLAIPSIAADPAHRADVRRSAEWLAGHLRQSGSPVADSDCIHAPNEKVEMGLLLKGAEAAAYLWDELAATAGDLPAAR